MNRAMKDSGVEWIGEIPQDWEIIKFKSCFNQRNSGVWGNDEAGNENDIICIRVADFDYSKMCVKNQDSYTKRNYAPHITQKLKLQKGDILIEKSGGGELTPVGRTIIFDKDFDALFANFIERVRVCEKFIPKFMQYVFVAFYKNDYTRLYIKQTTGIQNLDITSMFANERCILPIIDTQKNIVHYLDEKCREIDNIVDSTKSTIEEYKRYKQSAITEAVTKGLDPNVEMKDSGVEWIAQVPKNWKITRIKYILDESKERSIEGNEEPLSMSQQFGIIKSCELDVPNVASSYIGGKLVHKDYLVFNKLKAHLGVFAVSLYEGVVSPDYAVYVGKENTCVKFLEYLFKTNKCIQEFKKYISGVGAGLSRLYTSDLFNIKVALPDYNEQTLITKYIETKCSEIDNLISKKQQIITELETYKKSLIYECVTGKKVIGVSDNVQITAIIYPLFPASLATDKKRFAQAVLASKVIDTANSPQFGRVKLEKILYTIEIHIGFDFDTDYKRQVAGPLDSSIYQCENMISKRNKWFNVNGNKNAVKYSPTKELAKYKNYYNKYFTGYNAEIERIISIFKPLTTDQAEIIATLYASWNDFTISRKVFNDDDIVNDVLNNWHESKKRFSRDIWLRAIEQMRKLDLIPKGYGKKTSMA